METNAQTAEQPPPPQAMLLGIGMGAMLSQALGVAAELGIADQLSSGPKTSADLATSVGAHEPSLYRILRSLASAGVFTETGERTFVNSPMSEMLRSDIPGSMRSGARFMARPWHFAAWGNMLHSAKTGETTCPTTLGMEIFEFFAANPEESELFNDAMSAMSAMSAPAIVEAYDFSDIDTLADIAGGHGRLLSQILKANPGLKGILFDLEHVIAGAGEMLEREGVADRVTTASGDFFKEVPTADAYIMKHIIHDWDDDRAVQIMKTIHQSMPDNGRLLVVEMVVPEGNEPHPSKVLDLEMLTLPGGLERTEKEFRSLFERAGFRLSRLVPTKSAFSILEGLRA
ncbi:MAG TPA: methyltransferase [Pyrinomonadaceae bacterium]